ncbi:LLM class flavin-dependent oxidoreductase [Mycobacterium mantenii]|nr:LLM class flavin-dependent oxidoreductase [Mycobacterium mantenii]
MDSFWVPDHLNALLPRAIATPHYLGAARLVPKVDAYLEPWTMLGHIASWNRLGRLRLGVRVTDAGRRNPAVTAQAAATLHLLTRGRAILDHPVASFLFRVVTTPVAGNTPRSCAAARSMRGIIR